jgi:hypothetical protein
MARGPRFRRDFAGRGQLAAEQAAACGWVPELRPFVLLLWVGDAVDPAKTPAEPAIDPLMLINAITGAGVALAVGFFSTMSAETLMRLGRREQARAALARALSLLETTGDHFWAAETYRIQAALCLDEGDAAGDSARAEAETFLNRAIDTARRQQSHSLALRAAVDLAHLRRRQGREAEARDLVGGAYARVSHDIDAPDLRRRAVRRMNRRHPWRARLRWGRAGVRAPEPARASKSASSRWAPRTAIGWRCTRRRARGVRAGVEVVFRGFRDGDAKAQFRAILATRARAAAALAVVPINDGVVSDEIRAAADAGLPVLSCDTAFRGFDLPYVGSDNELGGRLAGQYLAGLLKSPGRVLALRREKRSAQCARKGLPRGLYLDRRRVGRCSRAFVKSHELLEIYVPPRRIAGTSSQRNVHRGDDACAGECPP